MEIRVNGESRTFEANRTVAEILQRLGYPPGSVAVALNEEFVPRTAYETLIVNEADHLEIVAPMQGG